MAAGIDVHPAQGRTQPLCAPRWAPRALCFLGTSTVQSVVCMHLSKCAFSSQGSAVTAEEQESKCCC